VVGLYYYFGEYDGVLIFEAPDDTTANALVMAATVPGHLKATRTTRLMTPSETVAAMLRISRGRGSLKRRRPWRISRIKLSRRS
jgi:uncharacterized protein with GYD domain